MKFGRYGYPVLSAELSRKMDRDAEDYGLPAAVLMENAGRTIAQIVNHLPGVIFVAAGSGNNGGDALVAARFLLAAGREVVVGLTKSPFELQDLCALNARRFAEEGGRLTDASEMNWEYADIILDGLLGTGMTGAPREPIAGIIRAINEAQRSVMSIDVPSGVNSDSGEEPGLAIMAIGTITLGCYKPALVHYPAAKLAGEVILADIGFPPSLYPEPDQEVLNVEFVQDCLPQWSKDSHKGNRGSLLVVAGSRGMAGAAAMAANSAVYSGAGLVHLACPETMAPVMETKVTEALVRPVASNGAPRFTSASAASIETLLGKCDAVVLGPGLSQAEDTSDFIETLLPRVNIPILLDADALNIMASRQLRPPSDSVLTPHPGEMARLLGTTVSEVQSDRPRAAREACERYGCTIVLKGAHTVITAPGEPVVVNLESDNVLATGGSGDVLSGIIGALLAQGLAPMHAALAGVYWHGTMGVLAASKYGGTVGAATMLKLLPRAREEILSDDEEEFIP